MNTGKRGKKLAIAVDDQIMVIISLSFGFLN